MIPKFLTVADGIMDVASRSSMGVLVIFFVRDGGPVIKIYDPDSPYLLTGCAFREKYIFMDYIG